jgi:hypothetical protein
MAFGRAAGPDMQIQTSVRIHEVKSGHRGGQCRICLDHRGGAAAEIRSALKPVAGRYCGTSAGVAIWPVNPGAFRASTQTEEQTRWRNSRAIPCCNRCSSST